MNWYYAQEKQQKGPVDEQGLIQLIASGIIDKNSLVWNNSMPNWLPLAQAAPQLAALAPSKPEAFSPPAESATAPSPIVQPKVNIAGQSLTVADKDEHIQRLREGVSPELFGNLNYAGGWIRWGARLIDGLAILLFMLLLAAAIMGPLFLLGVVSGEDFRNGEDPPVIFLAAIFLLYALLFFVPIVYEAVLVGKKGATWGKSALGLKVVTAQGTPVSKGKAWGRAFAFLINHFCGFILLMIFFDREKRGVHDMICDTRVIRS